MDIDPVTGEAIEEIEWGHDEDMSSLLGFNFDDHETEDRSGLRALINSSLISHPVSPALELVFDRIPSLFTKSLRHLASDALEVCLETVATVRFSDFTANRASNSVLGVIKSDSLDHYSLLSADPSFIYALVDILLGGNRAGQGIDGERQYTSIELALARRIFTALCKELSTGFFDIIEAPFTLEAVETNPRFAAVTRDNAVCALAKFRVDILGTKGQLHILLPYMALEPVRERLHQDFLNHAARSKGRWSEALRERVKSTHIDVHCVLAQQQMTLRQIKALEKGDFLALDAGLDQPVELQAGSQKLAKAHIGRSGEMLAVRLMQAIEV